MATWLVFPGKFGEGRKADPSIKPLLIVFNEICVKIYTKGYRLPQNCRSIWGIQPAVESREEGEPGFGHRMETLCTVRDTLADCA